MGCCLWGLGAPVCQAPSPLDLCPGEAAAACATWALLHSLRGWWTARVPSKAAAKLPPSPCSNSPSENNVPGCCDCPSSALPCHPGSLLRQCWGLAGHRVTPCPQGVNQRLIPKQRADACRAAAPIALSPVGEPVSSWVSLQWSCTPHLRPRSSGSCPARPRSCRPAATSRLCVPAMGTSASTTAGR